MSRKTATLWPEAVRNPALPALVAQLRGNLAGCKTILDVGCGQTSPMRFVQHAFLTGVDGYAPALDLARRLGTHDEYLTGDVRKIADLFVGKKFDACVAIDVIEHLPKEDGWRLLQQMESLARRRTILFTPNGFMPQQSKDGDLQEHLSGWSVDDFQKLGYQVFGMCGPKQLRGEHYIIRYKPRLLWALASVVIDYVYTRKRPQTAAALFAVKSLR